MDLDLKPGWEKKALIVLGIIVFIIIIYAFNPFQGSANVEVQNGTVDAPVAAPVPQVETPDNSTANNTTAVNTTNTTFQISADVAKNIATGANPGFTAGEPTQGTVNINNTVVSVWIVPLTQSALSKKIYVDSTTGIIVGSA